MKEIRTIKDVVSPTHIDNTNGVDQNFVLDTFESMPQHYPRMVLPMLSPRYKNQLSCWLDNFKIIKLEQICKMVTDDNKTCSKLGNIDKSKYDKCTEDRSTGDISTISTCTLSDAIKILFEWCKGSDTESMGNILGIDKSIVSGLCMKASDVADKFMRLNINEWRLGGPGVVVIIDMYPEGCANTNQLRMGRPILCISEVRSIPQRYWLEALDDFNRNDLEQINCMREYILHMVQLIVLPGSVLITPFFSTLCCYSDFEPLRTVYPTIVNVRDLARHNNDQQNVNSNLATIWKAVLDVCEEAQFYNSRYVQQFIVSHMWRRRFAERSFDMFLCQLSVRQ